MTKFVASLSVVFACLIFAAPVGAQVGYGRSVAIGDGEVMVGESANQANPGFVYVYRPEGGGWIESASLTASDASNGDGFGTTISVDGGLMFVSAVSRERGLVYVYRREGAAWREIGTLTAADRPADERFGTAVAQDGDTVAVGAPSADDGWGAAYVFEKRDDRWVEVARITGTRPPTPATEEAAADAEGAEEEEAPEPPMPERFGSAVEVTGDWVIVGAPMANKRAGLAYVFAKGEAGYELVNTVGDFSEENDRFGSSLRANGSELLVGAVGADQLGSVRRFAYDHDSGQLNRVASLMPFEGSAFGFGSAIAVDGDHVYVSAPGANSFQGVIFRFTGDGDGNWSEVTKIGTSGLGRGSAFAGAMAVRGGMIVAGIPGEDFGAGTAMILTPTYGGWDRTKVMSEIKGLEAIVGSNVPCDTGTAGHFGCQGIDLLAYLPIHAIGGGRGVRANDIWGWSDPESGRDYAIVGLTTATSFVDVTDPYNPVYVGKLPKTPGSNGSIWRDIKVHADHAFIVSDSAGQHGMQVFDLMRLREFDDEPVVFTEDAHYGNIASAHNVVINEESAFAFIVGASGGGETCGGGLHMVNIEDPKRPQFAGCFQDVRTGRRGTGYSHDAQCVTYEGPDERYSGREICFGSNETALSVADVSDKRNPQAIGMSSYPNVAYSHQGWLTEDHRYFYMNDEGDEASGLVEGTRTIIWDVQDLEDPIVVGEYISDNPAVDHNLYVTGTVMYQSNYDSGLRVFDVSDPENIQPIGYLDTVPYGDDGQGMGGSWSNYPYFGSGIVVVTSMSEGFFVAKVRDDARVRPTGPSGSE